MNDVRRSDEEATPATREPPIIHLEEAEGEPVVELESPFSATTPARPPSLSSPDPEERRAALMALASKGLTDADARQVEGLVGDPRPDLRGQALQVMERAGRLRGSLIYRALQDPSDEVRAIAVRLAASQGGLYLADLCTLVAARHSPLTQRAALEVVPALMQDAEGPRDRELALLLLAVAQMPSPPMDEEHGAFAELARAIGIEQLADHLETPDRRRLGAVRLLVEEGAPEALRAVAALGLDELEEVRVAATAAASLLGPVAATEPRVPTEEEPEGAAERSPAQTEVIASLARALGDPDPSVRDRASSELSKADPSALESWVRVALRGIDEVAALAALLCERLSLSGLAPDLLRRAAELPSRLRGPFVSALSSFALEPDAVAGSLSGLDVAARAEAVRIAWDIGGRAIVPRLRSALKDSYGPVRMAALDVLDESKDPTALDVAWEVLGSDASSAVRARAARLLADAPDRLRLAAVERALQDPHPDVRLAAMDALHAAAPSEALPQLLKALTDPDERVWLAAVRRVAEFPEEDLEGAWTALLRSAPRQRDELESHLQRASPGGLSRLCLDHAGSLDPEERALAIEVGGRAGGSEMIPTQIRALGDPAAAVRRAAVAALSLRRGPDVVGALGEALTDPDPAVRVAAARALGAIDDDAALGFLVSALKDPEIWVREVAGEILTQWRSPAVAARLAAVLPDPGLRRAAFDLLPTMGGSAVEPLLDLLPQPDLDLARTIGELLNLIAGLRPFVDRLASTDPQRRLRAAEAIAAVGGTSAVDALVNALTDPDERVRIRVLHLLATLGDRRALDAVERTARTDPVPEVARTAEEAVARLGPE